MTTAGSGDAPRFRLRGIYALVDPQRAEPVAFTEAILRGGIRLVQIRANRLATSVSCATENDASPNTPARIKGILAFMGDRLSC